LRTISILNSAIYDELNKKYSAEFAKDFAFFDNKVKVKKDDKLYLLSFFLAEQMIEDYKFDIPPNEHCKIVLTRLIYQYLLNNSEINVEGFLNFRAKVFYDELRRQAEEEAKKARTEQEYEEFINLLKYYIAMQVPKHAEITVVFHENDFQILDKKRRDITGVSTAEFIYNTRNNDDLLISTLIFLAPKKMYIENFDNLKNQELKKTLSDVFKNRIISKTLQI